MKPAKPLIGLGAAALALGAWAYFTLSGAALTDAAAGAVSEAEHLKALITLQHLILTIVVTSVVLVGYGLWLLTVEEWHWQRGLEDLLRQVRRFEEGDWHDESSVKTGDELEEIGKELNALARKHKEAGESDEAEEIKSRFLEIISHQLRTPLTAVRWNLEALLKGDLGNLKREQADLLRITEKNYHGVLAMLADWVEALEVERGLLRLNFAPVGVAELVANMAPEMKQQASLKRQKLSIAIAKDLPPGRADRLKLRFILNKLISNAMDYTPEGGRVALRATGDAKQLRFAVIDSGVGIPEADQSEIFKKFFRAGNATMMQPNASGVGLFVTRILVEAHGGEISFSSTEGAGTTFTFTIPVFEGVGPKVKRQKSKVKNANQKR